MVDGGLGLTRPGDPRRRRLGGGRTGAGTGGRTPRGTDRRAGLLARVRAGVVQRLGGPMLGPWLIILALAGVAATLTPLSTGAAGAHQPVAIAGPGWGGSGVVLAWWLLAPLFALAELLVVHVEIHQDAHSFTLSELPFVLALLFATPQDLLVARTIGAAVALAVVERQPLVKLVFNLTLFWAEGCLALVTFQQIADGDGSLDARTWTSALGAVAAASVLGSGAVWAVIRAHGGRADPRPLLLIAVCTAVCNASLAGVTAVLLTGPRWALVPLACVLVVVVGAYRRYNRLAKRFSRLEALHSFTTATGEAVTHEEVVASVLESARSLLGAGTAAIELRPAVSSAATSGGPATRTAVPAVAVPAGLPTQLWERVVGGREAVLIPADTQDTHLRAALAHLGALDAVVAPLVSGPDVVGALLVADRVGDLSGTFDADDVRLLTTLAAQAGVALEKGRAIQRAHDQARAREYEALHDALTGLPNRTLFSRELDAALAAAAEDDSRTAVLLMDLDQFKEVNDTLGHHTGDLLLQQVADRLRETVGARGLVARLGGDEFAVLLSGLTVANAFGEALALGHRLHTRMTDPVRLASLRLEIGASIGVAMRPDHGDDGEVLLQRADVAMYAAKRARERVARYDPQTDWSSPTRLRLAADLRAALASRQLSVRYQPIARVDDLEVSTVEALARWPHPELGELGPEEFIPIAERTGLIGSLTAQVLERSLEQIVAWRTVGLDIRAAVNLSVQVLLDGEWPATVLSLLHRYDVPPDHLVFEITETSIMSDPKSMIPLLNELAAAGIAFSIDDFGTGHSSLAYLQRLPVREVKIDKSFVLPMTTDPNAASIVRSVVDLARNLGLRTIAEGVEDAETVERLREMRCDSLQGFHLSPPLTGDELTGWLIDRRRLSA